VGLGAEVARGVHLARPSPRGHEAGWRAPGRLGSVRVGLLTGGAGGVAGAARERLRGAGAGGGWQGRREGPPPLSCAIAWQGIMQHEAQPQESQQYQLVEKRVRYHGKAPYTVCNEGILPDFWATGITRKIEVHDQTERLAVSPHWTIAIR